jgi:predicted oxidoreductase
MRRRKLGTSGPEVGAIGLGCMGMSDFYGAADRAESLATIHAALDSGATLIDTGDFYGSGNKSCSFARRSRTGGARITFSASNSARCAIPRPASSATTRGRRR